MANWVEATITERINWAESLVSLRFHAALSLYKAGQYGTLGLDIDGKRIARPFSYSSAPTDDFYEIYLVSIPQGALSPKLYQLQKGDKLWVMFNAHGFFTLDEVPTADNLWLFATGTGLAPYISILKTAEPWQRFKKIVLVHGVRTTHELTYQQQIQQLSQTWPGRFIFIPCTSREKKPEIIEGRIPSAITAGQLEAFADLPLHPETSQIMLCGNPDMVKDTLEILIDKGFSKNLRRSPGNITTEKYW